MIIFFGKRALSLSGQYSFVRYSNNAVSTIKGLTSYILIGGIELLCDNPGLGATI